MTIQAVYERNCADPNDIHEHLPTLRQLVIDTNAQQAIELGIGHGYSTSALLAGLEETGGRLWACDIEPPDAAQIPEIWSHPQLDSIITNDLDVVVEAPECDVLFIDSAHNYDQTLAELRAYVPKLRAGGVLAMHDTVSWAGHVDRAIRDYYAEDDRLAKAREEWRVNCNGLFLAYLP